MKQYLSLARIDKPWAILLLLTPSLWGFFFHTNFLIHKIQFIEILKSLFILLLGSILARSFGCVVNDIMDADFDKNTSRTHTRPIASKNISKKNGIVFAIVLAVLSSIMLFFIPVNAVYTCIIAFPLILLYPLAKRYTYYPQIILGIVFNLGIFVGYFLSLEITRLNFMEINGEIFNPQIQKQHYKLIILYLISILWTVIYDTIYAMQDIKYDIKNKVKAITIVFCNVKFNNIDTINTSNCKNILFLINFIIFILLLFVFKFFTISFYISIISTLTLFIIIKLTFDNKISYKLGFNLNNIFGIFILFAILTS